MTRRLILALLPLCLAPALAAQDTRTVTEPVLPPLCATLDAQLHSIPRLAPAAGRTLAEADESKLDTARIQKALDHCGKGLGLLLRASASADAFLTGPLELRFGVALIVGKGAILFASRDPSLYATSPGSCGLVNQFGGRGCKPLISADHVSGAAIMGDGVIDARGGEKLLGKSVSPWDLAEQARAGGRQQVSRILVADYADNFTLHRITLRNSPNFHVSYNHGNGFTVWALKIDTPQRLARNTDGVDPGNGTRNVTITHSFIRAGDDNVAIKGGPDGATNMTISHNHFYWGHGMSIGSETDGGVSHILVTDLSLDGPDNALRIQSNGSRGGLTQDVLYDDVCIRNSPNPITLDTAYSAAGTLKGNSPPTMAGITLRNVRVSGGGKITFNGYDQQHRIAATLDGVLLTDQAAYSYSLNHADLKLGPGLVNLQFPAGSDSTIQTTPPRGVSSQGPLSQVFTSQGISSQKTPPSGVPASCAEKFVDFPAQ
jgi:polygalacturonase